MADWFRQLPDDRHWLKKDYEVGFSVFLAGVVFRSDFDPSIKLALKHDLSVEQAMSDPVLAWRWRCIMMELEQDTMPLVSQMASDHSLGLADHHGDFEFHVRLKKKAI